MHLHTSSIHPFNLIHACNMHIGCKCSFLMFDPASFSIQVVIFGCEGLMYCGRQLDVSEDGSTWSTVLSRSTFYDAGLCYSHNSSCAMLLGKLLFSSHPAKENDTAPTVEYDDIEDSHGTIFRFDLRAVRYVRVWSSISSTATAVHFAEIAPGRVSEGALLSSFLRWFSTFITLFSSSPS